MIAAWELDELPDEWVTAFVRYSDGYVDVKAAKRRLSEGRSKWLRSHPTYKHRMN